METRSKEISPMSDMKTTTVGILLLVAAATTLIAHALSTGITTHDLQTLCSALAGVGLIMAKDSA